MSTSTDHLFGMKRKPPSRKLKDADKACIKNSLDSLVSFRHKATIFPLPDSDEALCKILDSTLPQELVEARNMLAAQQTGRDMLSRSIYTKLVVDGRVLRVQFSTEQYYCSNHDAGELDIRNGKTYPHTVHAGNKYYDDLAVYTADQLQLRHQYFVTKRLYKYLVDMCNTSGQLVRAWPEIIRFLPSHLAEPLEGANRNSRLPAALDILRVNDEKPTATAYLALMAMVKDVERKAKVRLL